MTRPVIAVTVTHELQNGEVPRDGVRTAYLQAVMDGGGAPLLLPNVPTSRDVLRLCDGLLLTGGGDVDPGRFGSADEGTEWSSVSWERDETELALVWEADRLGMPVFGICRGLQVMAVGFGGTLMQDISRQRPDSPLAHSQKPARQVATHSVEVSPGSRLAAIVGIAQVPVNSFHHQAVDRIPTGWQVTGRSEDGLIEALERAGPAFRLGVQWHPEDLVGGQPTSAALFAAFVKASAEYRQRRSSDV
ncbi:MAG: gamma-glutamyl-gamma-aminobutyrate hydrolase family protein [Thermaerobacter sp.]|nr:gamma-glutamyl-gamma-aminobutyrate hydrolase family protein [Thermaerobacter sp.]